MATIAVLVAMGITAISMGYSVYQDVKAITYQIYGFDLYFYSDDEKIIDEAYNIFDKYDNTILNEMKFERYLSKPEMKNIPDSNSYYFGEDFYLRVHSQSQYNKIIDATEYSTDYVYVDKGNIHIIDDRNAYPDDWKNSYFSFSDRNLNIRIIGGNQYGFGGYLPAVVNDTDFNELLASGDVGTKINNLISLPFIGINYTDALTSYDIAKRLLPIFIIPVLVGIFHSIFSLKVGGMLLLSSYIDIFKTSALIYGIYILVYAIFYFITKNQYKRTINQ